jgi:CHAT domain-containing protein/Tfp pilus assembly protein PilF
MQDGQPLNLWAVWGVTLLFIGSSSLFSAASGQESTVEQAAPALEHIESLNQRVVQLYRHGKENEAFEAASRALVQAEGLLEQRHPALVVALNNLALLYRNRGNYRKAESLYWRALAIREKNLSPSHPDLARSANNLGTLYYDVEDYARAEPLLQRARQIYEHLPDPPFGELAQVLGNLGALYQAQRHYARAEPLLKRALDITVRQLGETHPAAAVSCNNLGMLYYVQQDYRRAEPLLQRALSIAEQTLGKTAVAAIQYRSNLGMLYAATGDITQAVTLLTEAASLLEMQMGPILAAGAESEKRSYMLTFSQDTDAIVSFHTHTAPRDPQALRLALTTVLRRKGRVLDAMANAIGTVRRQIRPQDASLLERLTTVWSQLALLERRGPQEGGVAQPQSQLAQLEEERRVLEETISARSAVLRLEVQPLTLDEVQTAIPEGAVLVEIVTYRPFYPRAEKKEERWGARRYVAYVLHRAGDPVWVSLGDAKHIDRAIARLHRALSHPDRREVKVLARILDALVMHPIRQLLGEARTILLCPDGALHLVPFGALVDEDNRYLLETFTFSYLTSGRDLLRLREHTPSRTTPLIVANPAFSEAGDGSEKQRVNPESVVETRRSVTLQRARFSALPGSGEEAEALKHLFPEATILTGVSATKEALLKVRGPSILHVATHGFFSHSREEIVLTASGEGGVIPWGRPQSPDDQGAASPLLRSGLALAGANRGNDGEGILTALEAAGLDLWGTRLVVLSACETGIGDIENGEGVYGLRRAMVIAGAESQVMSLWKVGDRATRDLMVEFYQRLLSGEGRAEGLRQAQLSMLRTAHRSHPFYWAGFIVSGDWKPINSFLQFPMGKSENESHSAE